MRSVDDDEEEEEEEEEEAGKPFLTSQRSLQNVMIQAG